MAFGWLARVIEAGTVRAITARDVQRNWKAVMAAAADGERLVITHHGRPKAILLSMRDAVGVAVDAELERLEIAGLGDWEAGTAVRLLPDADPRRVYLSREASRSLERHDRPMLPKILRRELRTMRTEAESPHWIRGMAGGGRWLIPFSLMTESGPAVVLLHDVIDAWEIEEVLIGPTLARARSRREAIRLEHCRDPGPVPLAPTNARRGP